MQCGCGSCDACLKVVARVVNLAHENGSAVLPFDIDTISSRAVVKTGRTLTSRLWPLIRSAPQKSAVTVPAELHASLRAWLASHPTELRFDRGRLTWPSRGTAARLAAAGARGVDLAASAPDTATELEALVASGEAFVFPGTSLVFSRALAPPKDGMGPVFVHAVLQ